MTLITVAPVTEAAAWNSSLASLPAAHVLQSWEWGQFKARHSWRPRYLLWQNDEGVPCATALVLCRQLGRWPLCILYVPKGPALDYDDQATLEAVLNDLEELARRKRAIFIKIDPDVEIEGALPHKLRQREWIESRQQIQFRNTMLVDLRQDDEALLAAMHSKTRYNIRLAVRKGVTVREGHIGDLDLLYDMYRETAQRDGFIIRSREYYHDAWGNFIEAGLGQPLLAEVEDQPVAGLILFKFGKTAYYFYGMSRNVHRDKMPNHRLQWEAMQWARAKGCTTYDLWGAPNTLDENDPMYGVYRFKKGYGARFVRHIGAWDYTGISLLYRLYTIAIPRLVALMHKRHTARSKVQEYPFNNSG